MLAVAFERVGITSSSFDNDCFECWLYYSSDCVVHRVKRYMYLFRSGGIPCEGPPVPPLNLTAQRVRPPRGAGGSQPRPRHQGQSGGAGERVPPHDTLH
eukprot:967479-Prorocentrum_minimum.AAC.5